jgi:Ca-activated chloride channel family protein
MTAYALAEKNYINDGNNRVILSTDGDFNVGVSDTNDLANLVGEKRGNGVYMSILGFGTGNIRDDIMETLSKEGNGNYSYIYDLDGAKKVLVEELAANLFTVADDVKAQVEFNPQNVKSYRLVGYENRSLGNEDFEDDTKDAGEIGAGTDVVMMFELGLYGTENESGRKYSQAESGEPDFSPDFSNELFEVRLRYKNPGEAQSKLMTRPVFFGDITDGSRDFTFACSVAAFGHLLRGSDYAAGVSINDIREMAEDSLGRDAAGYRRDYLDLLEQYRRLV